MKLEHLIQTYKVNNIDTQIKDMSNEKERAGVINFTNEISASYLLDEEDIVIAIKIFSNCLMKEKINIDTQVNHVIKILNVMQQTIMSLANISQKECNMILDKLGMFNNTFQNKKQIEHIDHRYKIEVIDGVLCLSIYERVN